MPYPKTVEYIKKQLDKGTDPDKIKKGLTDSGYQPEIIDKLMEQAGALKSDKKPTGIETILKDVAIGVVLLLMIRRPRGSTLFRCSTLVRSRVLGGC